MTHNHVLEQSFLQNLCDNQVTVSVFLMSGIKLHGVIEQVDDDVILLKDAITQMVYKHAISTVVPTRSPA
jgi:host factor-I protein